MMRISRLFLCLGLVASACGDDDAPARDAGTDASLADKDAGNMDAGGSAVDAGTAITLRFEAKVGDEDFECGRVYDGLGSSKLAATPRDFRFFVQDIALITRDGSTVPFQLAKRAPYQDTDVAMIDFTNGEGACGGGPSSNVELTGYAPPGDYDGIAFVNGVPETLNHQNIALSQPPLQEADLYWGWQNGYRFFLAELGTADGAAEDAGTDDAGISGISTLIHTGSGGCAGSNSSGYTCERPNRNQVRLTGFDPTKKAIVADLAQIFSAVDLAQGQQCHGAGPGCEPLFSALGLDFETGAATSTQRVFRTE